METKYFEDISEVRDYFGTDTPEPGLPIFAIAPPPNTVVRDGKFYVEIKHPKLSEAYILEASLPKQTSRFHLDTLSEDQIKYLMDMGYYYTDDNCMERQLEPRYNLVEWESSLRYHDVFQEDVMLEQFVIEDERGFWHKIYAEDEHDAVRRMYLLPPYMQVNRLVKSKFIIEVWKMTEEDEMEFAQNNCKALYHKDPMHWRCTCGLC